MCLWRKGASAGTRSTLCLLHCRSEVWLVVVGHLVLHRLLLAWHHWHARLHLPRVLMLHHLLRELLLLGQLLGHHNRLAEHVNIGRVLHVVDQDVQLSFADALTLQEILHCEQIEAHLAGLLHELLALVNEVLWDHARLRSCWPH